MKSIASIFFLAFLVMGCSHFKQNNKDINLLRAGLDNPIELGNHNPKTSKGEIATFLTFQKEDAEQAMNFYMDLFDNSKIIELKRWGKEAAGKEGNIMHATFTLNGKLFMCSDSPPIHEWGFTPAVSNFVECADESELEMLFTKLSENGKIMMPLNNYGFSQQFGFVEDRFGVSWQLNLN